MTFWGNTSLDNLEEIFEGILYIEEWADINGCDVEYQVSSFGRVKSLNFQRSGMPSIMKQSNCIGYRVVSLRKDKKSKTTLVHRLVAKAFIPNPENKKTVQHRFYDTSDNRFHQLEWFTHSEQHRHSWDLGRRELTRKAVSDNQIKSAILKRKPVYKYNLDGTFVSGYERLEEAAKSVSRGKMAISDCARGVTKKSGGFLWSYVKHKKLNPKHLTQ